MMTLAILKTKLVIKKIKNPNSLILNCLNKTIYKKSIKYLK